MVDVVNNVVDTLKDYAKDSVVIVGSYVGSGLDSVSENNSKLLVFVGVLYTIFRIVVLVREEIRQTKSFNKEHDDEH